MVMHTKRVHHRWTVYTHIDISLDSDIEIIYYINADVSAAVSLPSSEQG